LGTGGDNTGALAADIEGFGNNIEERVTIVEVCDLRLVYEKNSTRGLRIGGARSLTVKVHATPKRIFKDMVR
jgi:hypothetical protein